MENIEYRAVIKFLCKKGNTPTEIYSELVSVYATSAPSYSMVKKWAALFKAGRESLEDDPRTGRPRTSTDPDHVAAVEKIVLSDRRVKVAFIAEQMHISEDSVIKILHESLGLNKISSRWIPRLLSPEQKWHRVECSQALLGRYNTKPNDFESRLITGDETWLYQYDPTTKQESMQWQRVGDPAPVKCKAQKSAGTVMAVVFWDVKGIVHLEYMENGRTVTGNYYAQVLQRLRADIDDKRPGHGHLRTLLLQDNAPSHSSQVAMDAATQNRFEILEHPPYSPDLAPSDFHLFRNLKKALRGRRYEDNEEVKTATEQWFTDQPVEFYQEGIRACRIRWQKCIDVGGEYLEK